MEPKIIKIHKAAGLREDDEVQSLRIEASEQMKYQSDMSFDQMAAVWREEGKILSDALFDHLPGGLIDGLLAAMLERKASLFVVKF